MTLVGFLPHRWRPSADIWRHAEAIAGVLHTAPLRQTAGPAIVSPLGTADVLPYLVAIKSLHRLLARGGIVIIDDGTLTGEDRAILAHHCGDPELVPHPAVRRGPFPPGADWATLLTILDRRGGRYWIALDPHTVTLAPVGEIERAIASNRSFALAGQAPGIAGFAAGAAGRTLALAWIAGRQEGELVSAAEAAQVILTSEPEPVALPPTRYALWQGKPRRGRPALIHFAEAERFSGEGYAAASASAIAGLAR
jgi:hypothetical protein